MEVHHHAHLASGETHTTRKKWTHHFWEFLMLFLAVFCGFLAEYQLEHKMERDRVKEYALQMVEGLKKDTAQLSFMIRGEKELVLNRVEPFINRHFMRNQMTFRFGDHIPTPGWDSTRIGKAPKIGFFNADDGTMLEFQNLLINARGAAQLPANNKVRQLKRAEALMVLLQKEYHLK